MLRSRTREHPTGLLVIVQHTKACDIIVLWSSDMFKVPSGSWNHDRAEKCMTSTPSRDSLLKGQLNVYCRFRWKGLRQLIDELCDSARLLLCAPVAGGLLLGLSAAWRGHDGPEGLLRQAVEGTDGPPLLQLPAAPLHEPVGQLLGGLDLPSLPPRGLSAAVLLPEVLLVQHGHEDGEDHVVADEAVVALTSWITSLVHRRVLMRHHDFFSFLAVKVTAFLN